MFKPKLVCLQIAIVHSTSKETFVSGDQKMYEGCIVSNIKAENRGRNVYSRDKID